jgi:hypothetical protein
LRSSGGGGLIFFFDSEVCPRPPHFLQRAKSRARLITDGIRRAVVGADLGPLPHVPSCTGAMTAASGSERFRNQAMFQAIKE